MFLRAFGLLIFFSTSLLSANAQSRFEKDSSWIRFEKMKNDTNKVMSLFSKALETSVYDLDLSGFYAHKTNALAEKLKFQKGIIYSSDLLGNYYLQNGKYNKAYSWMNKSIQLKEKKGDPFDLAIGYNQLAVLFRQMQNFPMAKKFSRKSIGQSIKLKNDRFISLSTSTLSNIFYENKEYDSSLLYSNRVLEIAYKLKDSSNIALSLTNQGLMYNDLKKYELAIEKSLEGKKYISSSDLRLQLICESNLAASYLGKNDLGKAQIHFDKIFSITDEFSEADQLMLAYKLYSEFLFKKGNYKEAFEYKTHYQEMQDSIDDVNVKKEIVGLETKYQSEKKEKENQILKQKSEIDELTISDNERKSFQLKMILAFSGLILVLMIFFIFNRIRSARKLATQNEQINRQNDTLRILNRDLIESEEQLQKSNETKAELLSIISHDISSPVNSLYTFQLSILEKMNSLTKEEISNDFIKISSQTKQVHELMNNLLDYCYTQQNGFIRKDESVNLNVISLECAGIFENNIREKKLKLNFDALNNSSITSDANLLRLILRNLLSNAIKFSPTEKTISFSYENGILSIHNEGTEIDSKMIERLKLGENNESKRGTIGEKGTGLGMKIVRNAARLLESEFIVESYPNNGNTFGIRID